MNIYIFVLILAGIIAIYYIIRTFSSNRHIIIAMKEMNKARELEIERIKLTGEGFPPEYPIKYKKKD